MRTTYHRFSRLWVALFCLVLGFLCRIMLMALGFMAYPFRKGLDWSADTAKALYEEARTR